MSLTPQQLERYARHIMLREIGGPGQQKLRRRMRSPWWAQARWAGRRRCTWRRRASAR